MGDGFVKFPTNWLTEGSELEFDIFCFVDAVLVVLEDGGEKERECVEGYGLCLGHGL